MTTTSQKDIARQLDILADRSWKRGAAPATTKQVWYLAGLLLKAQAPAEVNLVEFFTGLTILNMNDCLTKSKASVLINELVSA
jgi:hypothetical protein